MAMITFASQVDHFNLLADGENYLTPARFQYALGWDAGRIEFTLFTDPAKWQNFPSGRIWGDRDDLQWRRRDDGWHFVLLTECGETAIPEIFPAAHQKSLVASGETYEVFLWGEYDKSAQNWIEIKVPKRFNYRPFFPGPADPPARVRLQVYAYECPENRRIWEFGQKVELPFVSRVYRYGKIIGAQNV